MSQNQELDERLPKQFGDFGECLVMYILGRYKKMRVALVDHVGADLIATDREKNRRYAISVKGRNFPDEESKTFCFDHHNIDLLSDFADSFAMIATVAFVFVDNMEADENGLTNRKIRIFILTLEKIKELAVDPACDFVSEVQGGYNFKFIKGKNKDLLGEIKRDAKKYGIDYTELNFSALESELAI